MRAVIGATRSAATAAAGEATGLEIRGVKNLEDETAMANVDLQHDPFGGSEGSSGGPFSGSRGSSGGSFGGGGGSSGSGRSSSPSSGSSSAAPVRRLLRQG
ncbi:hypothetical protein GUJ93_ZPchr0014g47051 [Zizania palustris]|uniref:Uncharacterized protein n=1 Tax=Zizania palustris TaxID=103762 RepID=A0A8J5T7P2_ZIZPA|nr:hypothetical protein GUJ93_ZPchr0014g47051 [Zizania palustris]